MKNTRESHELVTFGLFQHRIVQYRIHDSNIKYMTGNKVALQLVEDKMDVIWSIRSGLSHVSEGQH